MKYERIKELLPKEFSKQKNVMFVEKAMRDARLLREYARFIVVLDKDQLGRVFVKETIDNSEKGYIANVIAVLAYVELFDGAFTLDQGLVLEVGISRGRPYQRAKTKKNNGSAVSISRIKGRRKLRDISMEEMLVIWPVLVGLITKHTLAVRGNWSGKGEEWFVSSIGRGVPRGAYFTVSESDKVLARKVILEDTRYLLKLYLYRKALHISWWLRRFKFSYYPECQLKSFEGVKKAVDMWKNARWKPRLARAVISHIPFGKKDLFLAVLKAHGLKDPFDDDPLYPDPFDAQAQKLPVLKSVWFYIPSRIREVQARGCLVFECLPGEGQHLLGVLKKKEVL